MRQAIASLTRHATRGDRGWGSWGGRGRGGQWLTAHIHLPLHVVHELGGAGEETTACGTGDHLLLRVAAHVVAQLVLALYHHQASCRHRRRARQHSHSKHTPTGTYTGQPRSWAVLNNEDS